MRQVTRPEWTGEVVRLMHLYAISQKELAEVCHYSNAYVGMILNGVRETHTGRRMIENALVKLLEVRT